jgi:cyclopropane fatty-acyl-phospholipid synthase-like methyltransferase
MKTSEDAFGREIYGHMMGTNRCEVIERDDGYLEVSDQIGVYFEDYREWPSHHREAIEHAQGRVLDIGCGAGRHALYLQRKGLAVTGIDVSPLAVKVCRMRGVADARVMSITDISTRLGRFDTVVMLANNFGLFGNRRRARWLLKKLHAISTDDAVILTESTDPYANDSPVHRRYRSRNRERGRMPGQIRLRLRYRQYKTPWFDFLLVSKREMAEIVDGTGWRVERFIDSGEPIYIGLLKKER